MPPFDPLAEPNLFSGTTTMPAPFFNITALPGMQNPAGMLAQVGLSGALQNYLGPEYSPGLFFPNMNLEEAYRRNQQYADMNRAIQNAAAVDKSNMLRMMRGAVFMSGRPWGTQNAEAAEKLLSNITPMTPLLSQMFPEAFDALMGRRGSAEVMARSLFAGGRYAIDPVTGTLGMTPETVGGYSTYLSQNLFNQANIGQLGGLTMGRAGQLFDEFQRRGLMQGPLPREQAVRELALQDLRQQGPLPQGQALGTAVDRRVRELEVGGGPELNERLRSVSADRMMQQFKNISGTIAAVKDILGELGQPNAPMAEIIANLQKITQSNLANMSPAHMQQIVRNMANVAQISGISTDVAINLSAVAGQQARQMGLIPAIGVASIQSGQLFSRAFAVNEGGVNAGPYQLNAQQALALDTRLRMGGAASRTGNELGALLRMADDGMLGQDPTLNSYIKAVKAGQTQFRDAAGNMQSTSMQTGELVKMMQRGGADTNLYDAYRFQTAENQATLSRQPGALNVIRAGQTRDIIDPAIRQAIFGEAHRLGFTEEQGRTLGRIVADVALRGPSMEAWVSDQQREDLIIQRYREQTGRAPSPDEAKRLQQLSHLARGQIEEYVQRYDPLKRTFGTGQAMISMGRSDNLATTRTLQEQVDLKTELQNTMAQFGREGPLARIMEALAKAGPETTTKDVLAQVLGFNKTDERVTGLAPMYDRMRQEVGRFEGASAEVQTRIDEINHLRKQMDQVQTGDEKLRFKRQIDDKLRTMGVGQVSELGTQKGRLRAETAVRKEVIESVKAMAPKVQEESEKAEKKTHRSFAAITEDVRDGKTGVFDELGPATLLALEKGEVSSSFAWDVLDATHSIRNWADWLGTSPAEALRSPGTAGNAARVYWTTLVDTLKHADRASNRRDPSKPLSDEEKARVERLRKRYTHLQSPHQTLRVGNRDIESYVGKQRRAFEGGVGDEEDRIDWLKQKGFASEEEFFSAAMKERGGRVSSSTAKPERPPAPSAQGPGAPAAAAGPMEIRITSGEININMQTGKGAINGVGVMVGAK